MMATLLETRISITYEQWRALDHATRRTIIGACMRKIAYTQPDALRIARRMSDQGDTVSRYRCCFCGSFHVGHPPTMKTIADLALAIRGLHGDRPKKLPTPV